MIDDMSRESYRKLRLSGTLGRLHQDCVDAFLDMGGQAAPFEVQAWWEKYRSPKGWTPGGHPVMPPRVTELFNAEYLVKLSYKIRCQQTNNDVNVYELVTEPHGLPIGWNKRLVHHRIKELEAQLDRAVERNKELVAIILELGGSIQGGIGR